MTQFDYEFIRRNPLLAQHMAAHKELGIPDFTEGEGSLGAGVELTKSNAGMIKKKSSKPIYDFASPLATGQSVTAITKTASSDFPRWTIENLRCDITSNSSQLRIQNQSWTLDPVDQLLSIDVYIPFIVTGGNINVTIFNSSNYSGVYTEYSFNPNYLRQGWNSLRMWGGDTVGAAGTGTLALGAGKSNVGGGCDHAAAIGYCEILIQSMNGKTVYIDQARRGAKFTPALVMGFDATGNNSADAVFTKAGGVADVFLQRGVPSYFTATQIYDLQYGGGADEKRKDTLYNDYEWDCINHCWSHGATHPGGSRTVTASRSSNVVTLIYPAGSLELPVGSVFYQTVSGATPADINGRFRCVVASPTTVTYTAAGADGAATGTIKASTLIQDVVTGTDATSQMIIDFEVGALNKAARTRGFYRGLTLGAWPNNSCGDINATKIACDKAGVNYFRGVKGKTVKLSEFGVDNQYNFGSIEMGSGVSATTVTDFKNALLGAIGRGEHLWTFGHHVLDETTLGTSVDLEYPPSSGGNPAPPTTSLVSGWWYLGSIKRFIDEAVLPAVASDGLLLLSPTQWEENLRKIK